jgi:hypothetical protein
MQANNKRAGHDAPAEAPLASDVNRVVKLAGSTEP